MKFDPASAVARKGRQCTRELSAFELRASFISAFAEQGAGANVHIGHAACYRIFFRNEASERNPTPSTQRARCGRGSSLIVGPFRS